MKHVFSFWLCLVLCVGSVSGMVDSLDLPLYKGLKIRLLSKTATSYTIERSLFEGVLSLTRQWHSQSKTLEQEVMALRRVVRLDSLAWQEAGRLDSIRESHLMFWRGAYDDLATTSTMALDQALEDVNVMERQLKRSRRQGMWNGLLWGGVGGVLVGGLIVGLITVLK